MFYVKRFLILLCCLSFCSCVPQRSQQKYEESRLVYGEKITLDVCIDPLNPGLIHEAMNAAWTEINNISSKLGIQDEHSDIYKINHSFGHPARVSEDTYELVKEAVGLTSLSQGTFDITVGALEDLWKETGRLGRVPTREEILQVRESVGAKWVRLNPDRTIELMNPQTRIDLGGLAGGWAADKAVKVFQGYGYRHFMVAVAGAMYMSGQNCENRDWRIGISNPAGQDSLTDMVSVSDSAVDTSGDYEKYLIINGQKYSHIFNPITGYPQKGTTSATVIARASLVKTGALTIACCILSPRDAIKLIDQQGPGYAAFILYRPDGEQVIPYESRYYRKYKRI